MGHDIHFLERITERANSEHQAIALALYRDPELIRHMVASFGPTVLGEADRVALALDDGGLGPHVIVTKQGKFVTCLGEGMGVQRETPVISRAMVMASAEWRQRMKALPTRGEDPLGKLFKALRTQGRSPSRAEVAQVEALGVLYVGRIAHEVPESHKATRALTQRILDFPRAKRRALQAGAGAEILVSWLKELRYQHHCISLLCLIHPSLAPLVRVEIERYLNSFVIVSQAEAMTPMGLMWAARWLACREDVTRERLLERMALHTSGDHVQRSSQCVYPLAWMVYALSRPDEREEVIAALKRYIAEHEPRHPMMYVTQLHLERTIWALEARLDALPLPERILIMVQRPDTANCRWMHALIREAGSPGALGALLELEDCVINTVDESWLLWAYTPELATTPTRELFPEAPPRQTGATLLAAARRRYASMVPQNQLDQSNTPAQGRNEPCACGSGKKHKQCCGRGADA